jgi:hypothetical protein
MSEESTIPDPTERLRLLFAAASRRDLDAAAERLAEERG